VQETKLNKIKYELSTEILSHPGKHLQIDANKANYCYYMYKTEVKMIDVKEGEEP
jgi:hypothetical protein